MDWCKFVFCWRRTLCTLIVFTLPKFAIVTPSTFVAVDDDHAAEMYPDGVFCIDSHVQRDIIPIGLILLVASGPIFVRGGFKWYVDMGYGLSWRCCAV